MYYEKVHFIVLSQGLCPYNPTGGTYSAPPDHPAVKSPHFKMAGSYPDRIIRWRYNGTGRPYNETVHYKAKTPVKS